MFNLENTPGRTCHIKGKEFLFFSGYSYLGINHVIKFRDLVQKGIDKYGILFPSSRISNTRLGLYEEFENALSTLTGMESTVSFSSGYLAGKTISEILSAYNNIFVAPSVHPAINISVPQVLNVHNFEEWHQQITKIINASGEYEFVLIADSINIMQGVVNDFSFLQNLNPAKKIIFLIDDSHGIGILGKRGEGIVSQLPEKNNVEYIITYSLSKAFNVGGGAVSCSKKFSELLRQQHAYAGSTSISPSLIYAFLQSQKFYAGQQEKLFENINYFKKNLPFSFEENKFDIPIFICKDENAEQKFFKNQVIISSFGYPDAFSKKINRVVLNSLHLKNDIDKLCNCRL